MTNIMFKKNYLLAAFIFFAIIISASCSSSRKTLAIEDGWDLIGETKVNFVRDRETMTIYNTNRYTSIRFKVEKRDIRLNDVKIVYQNGDKLAPTLDDNLVADQYSREIELGPEGKNLRSIEFKFRTTGNVLKGRANVLVFGKRYVQPY